MTRHAFLSTIVVIAVGSLLHFAWQWSGRSPVVAVFAATNDRAVNHRIAFAAKRRGIPSNVADSAAECDFLVPARVAKGRVQIAISTGGSSPRLAAALRRKLEEIL